MNASTSPPSPDPIDPPIDNPAAYSDPARRGYQSKRLRSRITSSLAALAILAAILPASQARAALGPGTAPVDPPLGGLGIDGDLEANTPDADIGDWVAGPGGTGGNVLTDAGVPVDSRTTYHLIDPYTGNDNILQQGKLNEDPETWLWVENNLGTSKCDVNNAVMHFTRNPIDGHLWLVLSADRESNNGEAYIDFEFLQKTLTPKLRDDGKKSFDSESPSLGDPGYTGGRTVGDFILSVGFNGSSVPDFAVFRWEEFPAGSGTFLYRPYTPPTGCALGAVNTTSVNVPYGAFGGVTYPDEELFIEGAIDLTAILGEFDPCASLGVETILVKTKTSNSTTADLVDFLTPLQVSLTLGVADAGADQSECSEGATTEFTVSGTATPSPGDSIDTTTWSVVAGTGTAIIESPSSLETKVTVSTASVTLLLTVTTDDECTVTDTVTLTVKPRTLCSITGPAGPVCPKSTGNVFAGPAGAASYAWTIEGDGSIVGPTDEQTVTVTAGNACDGSFTLHLVTSHGDEECDSECSKEVSVVDTTAPVPPAAPADVDYECLGDVPAAGELTATDNCGATITGVPSDSTDDTDPCNVVITRTWTFTDACGNSASVSQKITVSDDTAPVPPAAPAHVDYECLGDVPAAGELTAEDNCGATVTGVPSDSMDSSDPCNVVITRTWTFTDACGNSASVSQKITVSDDTAPVPPAAPADVDYECQSDVPAAGELTAVDNCGATVTGVPSDSTDDTDPCNVVITRTWTFTDACGNSASVSQKITVSDDTAPVPPAAPADVDYECQGDVPAAGDLTAVDNCGTTVTGVPSDSMDSSDPCNVVITRTWTFTDACGNSASVSQKITVSDDTAPTLVGVPEEAEVTVQCAGIPAAPIVTATDACDLSVSVAYTEVDTVVGGFGSITRTWTATDDCGNTASFTQTITVENTLPPPVVCPPDIDVTLPYPDLPPPLTEDDFIQPGDYDCSGDITITYEDVESGEGCPRTITRTYTISNDYGSVTCVQIITQLCPSLVTNSSLCTFDVGGCEAGDAFRLSFSQRMDAPNQYKLTNSNPGQFYYNVFLSGEPGDPVDATATIPFPFVTHGAQPIHVYSDYSLVGSGEEICLIPSTAAPGFTIETAIGADNEPNFSPSGAAIIVLSDYSAVQRTTTVRIKDGVFPETGKLVITIHLDFAFKGTKEWTVDGTTAVGVGTLAGIRLDSCAGYEFSTDSEGSDFDDSQVVYGLNSFKKNPGFGAAVTDHADMGGTPRSGVKVEVWNASKTTKIGESMTNEDGFAFIPYKHKAKAADYWINVPAYNKTTKVTIKANGFGFGEFIVP